MCMKLPALPPTPSDKCLDKPAAYFHSTKKAHVIECAFNTVTGHGTNVLQVFLEGFVRHGGTLF